MHCVGDKIMQEKYWKYMVQMKAWIFYLDVYAEKSYRWEQRINMFCAVASSSSIAAWVIWEKFAFLWGGVIAILHVLTAVKGFLPYNKRLAYIKPFEDELKVLYIKMEYDWYLVANGDMSEEEINKLLFDYKKTYSDIESKYLKEDVLVERSDYMELADEKTNNYFMQNY